jgi:hypothetical protein
MAYTIDLLLPLRTQMLSIISEGIGAPRFKVYNSADALLATLPLADPAGTVNETTGVITLSPGDPESDAPATGIAAYATLEDGDGTVLNDNIEVVQSNFGITGKLAISTTSIIEGGTVELVSASIG